MTGTWWHQCAFDTWSYDPESGNLFWKINRRRTRAGTVAGSMYGDGYVYVKFKGKVILAHRICWFLHYSSIRSGPLDHINCMKNDNRISNLREASVTENNRNRPKPANNTSGFKGVSFHKDTGKYHARITVDKVGHSLGYHQTAALAHEAYSAACLKLHGDFSHV